MRSSTWSSSTMATRSRPISSRLMKLTRPRSRSISAR
jgi:hypothetical protein